MKNFYHHICSILTHNCVSSFMDNPCCESVNFLLFQKKRFVSMLLVFHHPGLPLVTVQQILIEFLPPKAIRLWNIVWQTFLPRHTEDKRGNDETTERSSFGKTKLWKDKVMEWNSYGNTKLHQDRSMERSCYGNTKLWNGLGMERSW